MERFCHKCGSLVSGSGTFCPTCGASMEVEGTMNSVDLSKPVSPTFANGDVLPNGDGTMGISAPQQQVHTAGGMGYANTAASTPINGYQQPQAGYQQSAGYSQPNPNTAQYPQGAPIVYNNYNTPNTPAPNFMTTGQWMLTSLILGLVSCIPVIGFIGYLVIMLVWAFGDTQRIDRKNWARASLIWMLIAIGIIAVLFIVLLVAGISIADAIGNSYYY